MTHVMVFLWASVFGLGITAIASAWVRWRLERLELLRRYSRFLALVNATALGLLLVAYVAANVPDPGRLGVEVPVAPLFLIASFWVTAGFVYELVVVARDLIGRSRPAWGGLRAGAVLAVAPVAALVGVAATGRGLSVGRIVAVSEILNVALVVAGAIVLSGSCKHTGSRPHAIDRRTFGWFCGLHLTALALIAAAALKTYPAAWFVLAGAFVIINGTPFVLLDTIVKRQRALPAAGAEGLGIFSARHGISEREREIIRLLLDGRTNREIGDVLCISSHTVKNHVYSVYRKAGIRNRVQLAHLVLGPSGKT